MAFQKIVIASGKGGVGKSMLTSSLAVLFAKKNKIVAVDCDVDAPNLAVWLNQADKWDKIKRISTSWNPVFDYNKCIGCGHCVENCRFSALKMIKNKPLLNSFLCEGCGVCEIICPQKAVKLKPVKNGEIRVRKTKYGFYLISGHLYPGETGSGKIVTEVKEEAEKYQHDLMLIDSAPGTGCPVIASLQDCNFAVLITEPTLAGFADVKKALKVVKHFNTPYFVVINKWDINKALSEKIKKWTGTSYLGKISYDKEIFKAISQMKPVLETNLKVKNEIQDIYNKFLKVLNKKQKFIK